MIANTARQHEEMTVRHLDLALKHWMALPRATQQETWQLEITRAFAREAEKRKKTDAQLFRVQQEANQLRAQVDRLGSCQWPREFAIFPPDTLPIPSEVARELGTDSKANSSRWEFDNVVAKWKRAITHDKAMGRSGTNHSHNAAVVNERKNSNKRGNANNNNNTNRPSGTSLAAATNATTSTPNSPKEAPKQTQQQSSYSQDPKRNSTLGPQPKRQRLNGLGNNTGNDNSINGAAEPNPVSRTTSSPNLAQMPPPYPRLGNPSSSNNITASIFRHYKPVNANGDTTREANQMDLSDEEHLGHGSDGYGGRDGDHDADGDGDVDADGDPDNGEVGAQDSSSRNENRVHDPNQESQRHQHGGGSGNGNFDGPKVLMDMRSHGVQSRG